MIETTQKAYISNIQKFCIHDGPGIRTVIFFMGCPLQCKWCQNPENLMRTPVIMFDPDKCTQCGNCIPNCNTHCSYQNGESGVTINRSECSVCGNCVDTCLTEARTLCGTEMTVDQVYHEVMKDEVFYRTSGGGITLSGGEATIYPDFIIELTSRLKAEGISVALETSGHCSAKTMEALAECVDVFLYDFKLNDDAMHKKWTGVSNSVIKYNLLYLASIGKRVIIRIPLIPGVNDGEEFKEMMEFLTTVDGIKEINILPFHQVGSSKYMLIEHDYEMEEQEECSDEIAEECLEIATNYGYKVNIGGWDIT